VALPALEQPSADAVVVIDEIGKMELASERFRQAVERLLREPLPLVATVQASRQPFTDALKRRKGVEVMRLNAGNRDELPELLAERLGPRV
jgi:nucleoside-triphosphatase